LSRADVAEAIVPIDSHAFEEGDLESNESGASGRRFDEFDCPVCSANNPYGDAFGDGDEIRCFYCGQEFEVRVTDSGRLKLRET
jgi:hypothetical protein